MGLDDGPNTYGYVHQNPLINVDPFGLRARTNPWNRFQNSFRGQGLNSGQLSQIYNQLNLSNPRPLNTNPANAPRNPELHRNLENLPEYSEEVLNGIPDECGFRSCTVEVLVCYCNPDDEKSCPTPNSDPSFRSTKENDPNCSCFIEIRSVHGL